MYKTSNVTCTFMDFNVIITNGMRGVLQYGEQHVCAELGDPAGCSYRQSVGEEGPVERLGGTDTEPVPGQEEKRNRHRHTQTPSGGQSSQIF